MAGGTVRQPGVDFIPTQRSMNSDTAISLMDVVLSFIKENQKEVQDRSSSFFSFYVGLVYMYVD
jgi:hypothetical protein